MAKYKALKSFGSSTLKRQLKEGEIIELEDKELIEQLEEAIKKHTPGYFEKLEEKKTRTRAKKEDE